MDEYLTGFVTWQVSPLLRASAALSPRITRPNGMRVAFHRETSVRWRPLTFSFFSRRGFELKAVEMACKSTLCICLMSAICASVHSQETATYQLTSLDCHPSRWNAVIPPSTALLSSVCDMSITLSKEAPALPARRGNHALHVLVSTMVDQVDIGELSANATSLKGARVIDYRLFASSDVSRWADRHTIGLQQVHLSLAVNLCGPMYLVAVWSYWPSAAESANLRPAVLASLSWPFRVACETEVDVALDLQIQGQRADGLNKNWTLIPGSTIGRQIAGMKLLLVHRNSSKSPSLMARTSVNAPHIWIYLRWLPWTQLNQSKADVNGLRLRVGDQLLHRNEQLLNLKAAEYFPEVKRGQSIALNLDNMRIQSAAICGEAALIFHLDPLQELADSDRSDNILLLPVLVNCLDDSLMGLATGTCAVLADEMSLGRRAVMFASGHSLGVGNLRAYQYKADDKTFRRLYGQDEELFALPNMFLSVLSEQERLAQLNKCPPRSSLTLAFQSTLFGHLYNLMNFVVQHWVRLQDANHVGHQTQWTTAAKALSAVMKVSAEYDSPAAYFVDGILNGLFSYWPFFPYGLSSNRTNANATEPWHDRLSKAIQYFLQTSLYSDYSGQPNPSQGFQNFLNQLLWSPEVLSSGSFTAEAVMNVRQLLLWALHRQMPRTFDDLPEELGQSLLPLASQIKSPIPVLETQVHSAVWALRSSIAVLMDRPVVSSTTTARPITSTPITSTALPVTKTSNGVPTTKPLPTTTKTPTVGRNAVNSSLADKLIVIDSLMATLDNPNAVVLLTRILQTVQANVALNKHWIMMEGLSDTSLDADISCRLHALSKLMARQAPNMSIDLKSKLDLITFWKTSSGVVFRGDVSSITGRLYWNRVAVCNCDEPSSFALRYQTMTDP